MQSYVVKRAFSKVLSQGSGFDKRIFLVNEKGEKLSFWNDTPLKDGNSRQSDVFNMTFEIPRYTIAKMELLKEEKFHPIFHDPRENKFNKNIKELRYYGQFGLFNYGFLSQTWENSLVQDEKISNLSGDDDPLDIIEISDKVFQTGSTIPVKVFGSLCLIDQGEVDWKVISLNLEDANAKNIKNLDDLENAFPARLNSIRHWFKTVKTFDGKKENTFHFEGKSQDLDTTLRIIDKTHQHWKELVNIGKSKSAKSEYEHKLLEKAKHFHFCD